MSTRFRKFALAAVTLSGLSLAALGIASAPAQARVVCDADGDDCRQVPDWRERQDNVVCDEDGDDCHRDRDWRDRDDAWRWRHAQEERREQSYRQYNWGAPYTPSYRGYDYYRPTSGASMWFGF